MITPTQPRLSAKPGALHIPADWHDNDLLTFEQFCTLTDTPQRTARDRRRRGEGPVFMRLEGNGRLYITVAELRRWLTTATPAHKRSVRFVRGGAAS